MRKGDKEKMNKQPELTAMTRKKLMDTYFEFMAQGRKPTVGAVTKRAGITKWYEMKQPIPIDQMGMLLKDFLQKGVLQQHSM